MVAVSGRETGRADHTSRGHSPPAPTPPEDASPMSVLHSFLASARRDEDGQGLAEYALILALIAIVAIVALIFLGGQISGILHTVGASV